VLAFFLLFNRIRANCSHCTLARTGFASFVVAISVCWGSVSSVAQNEIHPLFWVFLSASVLLLRPVCLFVCFVLQPSPLISQNPSTPGTYVCVCDCVWGVLCVSIAFISYYVNAWDLWYFLGLVNFQLVLRVGYLRCGFLSLPFGISSVLFCV
jgi:hypothetical protein